MEQRPKFTPVSRPDQLSLLTPELSGPLSLRATRHREIRTERPDLQQFMALDPRSRAHSLGKVGEYLRDNPNVLIDFNYLAPMADEDTINLLIQPDHPFILSRVGKGPLMAMVPGTTCTEKAIRDLFATKPTAYGQYDIVSGDVSKLEEQIWKMASKDPDMVLQYRRGRHTPAQYLAMAAAGMFNNEVLRMPVDKLLTR